MPGGRAGIWLFVAVLGGGLMWAAYWTGIRVRSPSPWTNGGALVAERDMAELPPRDGTWSVRLRFLEPSGEAVVVGNAFEDLLPPGVRRAIEQSWTPKLVEVPDLASLFSAAMLASGRLPEPGADEVLASSDADTAGRLELEGRALRVVGRLRPLQLPFPQSYLMPQGPASEALFSAETQNVHRALIFSRQANAAVSPAERQQLQEQVRQGTWTQLFPQDRAARGPYLLYLTGMALLLTGGSALLMQGYWALARRGGRGWLAAALDQTAQHRGLLVGLHVAYFGLGLLTMLVIYEFPKVQELLQMLVHGQINSRTGLLGTAADAYGSGNILWAAATTFGINFLVGSLLCITLPSLIVPGSGLLVPLYRTMLWGILLAPSSVSVAAVMLPHSLCLLLEGEGYILATFFGLLLPVFLLRSQSGLGFWARWRAGWEINFQGNLLVLMVLAVAALYEATEVIAQTWF